MPLPSDARPTVFVVYDGIQALDLTGPFEVFHGANEVLSSLAPDRPRYDLSVVSPDGGTIVSESGLPIGAGRLADPPTDLHTIVVPGGRGAQAAARDDRLVDAVQRYGSAAQRVISICSGTFVVAAAGLLDGRRVTTHWARAAALQRDFPTLDVDPDPIYVHDGRVWSSAGVTAGIDLALAVVEEDHDAEIAQVVARWLVMFLRRPGGQTQFAAPIWNERGFTTPIRSAQDHIDADPGADHRVGLLAERVGMSARNFTRRFTDEVGSSPGQYVSAVRLEAARRSLETSPDTIEAVARRCGFGTAETMRRTFTRRLGVSPDQYRQRFRSTP